MAWITKDEVDKIVSLYKSMQQNGGKGSVLKVAAELGCSPTKVRRVLITEGLWSSRSSREIGKLKAAGLSTEAIAEKLHMSVKNVQSYMVYEGGAFGEDTYSAKASRESRNRMRGKGETSNDEEDSTMESKIVEMEAYRAKPSIQAESDAHKMIKYAVDYKKMVFLLDGACGMEAGLPVVRKETIDLVKSYEIELREEYHKKKRLMDQEKEAKKAAQNKEQEKRPEQPMTDYFLSVYAQMQEKKQNPSYAFVYIDCAPGALDYVSPGMTFAAPGEIGEVVDGKEVLPWTDCWLFGPDRINEKSKQRKKLTYNEFVDRLSTDVNNRSIYGSAYEKVLQTQLELVDGLEDNYVLVFVNAHLLCDRSGGKYSKFTSVGDSLGIVRQIWERTSVPMIFLSSKEIVDVMDKDDEGKKLQWRATFAET